MTGTVPDDATTGEVASPLQQALVEVARLSTHVILLRWACLALCLATALAVMFPVVGNGGDPAFVIIGPASSSASHATPSMNQDPEEFLLDTLSRVGAFELGDWRMQVPLQERFSPGAWLSFVSASREIVHSATMGREASVMFQVDGKPSLLAVHDGVSHFSIQVRIWKQNDGKATTGSATVLADVAGQGNDQAIVAYSVR